MNNPFEVQSRTGWESRCLGELLRIKHGFAFQSKYFTEEGDFILLTPGNFFEEGGFRPKNGQEKYYSGTVPAEYLLSCGDLVVVMTEQADGLLGSSALIPESGRYLHNQRIGLIVDLNEKHVDKPFLYHLFNSKLVRRQIAATASGTKVRHTSPSRIYDVVVMMPPMAEQRYIADVLTTWDRAIDLTARLITAKQQRKRGLMQQLLTGRRRFQRFVVSDEVQHTDIGPLGYETEKWTQGSGEIWTHRDRRVVV